MRGFEEIIFDHICLNTPTPQWYEWLRTPLHKAAAAGDEKVTFKLLALGALGNPVIPAIRGGREALAENLITNKRICVEKDQATGDIPLHIAATVGSVRIVKSLLGREVNRDERDNDGRNALHRAVQHRHLPVVHALLAAGVKVNVVFSQERRSALSLACHRGHLEIAEALIQHGADVGSPPGRGSYYTPLQEAAIGNHAHCIAALVGAGANVSAAGEHSPMRRTPLHLAAQNGHAEAVSVLVAHGAAKHTRDESSQKNTPLHLAIAGQHLAVVEALLPNVANDFLYASIVDGCLLEAAGAGSVDIMKVLIKGGADVKAMDPPSQGAALHAAAGGGGAGAVDALIEAGADLDAEDVGGKTPLHYAAGESTACESVAALLKHGCDKDKKDYHGLSPLHVAASRGSTAAVVALLTAGADMTARFSCDGHSALDLAVIRGRVGAAEALV